MTKNISAILILLLCVLIFNGCKKKIDGCTDSTSLNYNPDATDDDGSCYYHTLGESYGGGFIFYIDGSGKHGLICAPTNQSMGIQWYNGSNVYTLATSTAVGTGQANTSAIVTTQGVGNYAAYLCDTLTLNGYSDWYLPSRDELDLLYAQKASGTIVGFANANYWSSTEHYLDDAWEVWFTGGVDGTNYKYTLNFVQAVRSF